LLRQCALIALAVVGCTPKSTPARDAGTVASVASVDVALDGETMGSTWHIKLRVPAGVEHEQNARAMQAPIDELLERVNDQMSTYRPNSEISKFNAHASTEPFAVSREFAAVVTKALEVGKATDGAYDITIDPLINLWGFDRKGRRETAPSAQEIEAARAHTGLSLVRVDGASLVKADPLVTINLGGIAAGWAVDELATLLEERGFHDFMIEVTGEVRAKGRNAKGAPWKIGVKVPDIDSSEVVAAVPLDDRSLTTSGSYHNFFETNGADGKPKKRYHHILDPKTGAPAETDLVSVTVMYADAVTADGYDTPFLILGEERARKIVESTPGMAALFIHQDRATGKLTTRTTPGFPALEVTK
jgi:FAD:protein FMN transferase